VSFRYFFTNFIRRYERFDFFSFVVVPALVGFLIGLFNVFLYVSVEILFDFILYNILGFREEFFPVRSVNEVSLLFDRLYLVPLLFLLAGLVVGILKEKYLGGNRILEGTGNFVIESFHKSRPFSLKEEAVRVSGTVITVGFGGTAGLLAPSASVGATISDVLSRKLGLSSQRKRILIASGFGAGVSSMFGTPLAGALIAAEAFYKFDFEVGVLVPASVASIVAFLVSSEFIGHGTVFEPIVEDFKLDFENVLFFVVFGLISGLFVRFFVRLYLGLGTFFSSLRIPSFLVPAIGAVLSSPLVFLSPFVIGKGDVWISHLFEDDITSLSLLAVSPFLIALSSSLFLSSGNGGGIFAPSITAGAFLGYGYAFGLNETFGTQLNTHVFTVIGMITTFGAGAKMPLSTLIIVAELTGSYELLIPAVASLSTALIVSGKDSFFRAQVERRFQSPTHRDEFELYVLKAIKVKEFMVSPVYTVSPEDPLKGVWKKLLELDVSGFPVLEGDKLVGIITKEDLIRNLEKLNSLTVKEVMNRRVITVKEEDTLFKVLGLMMEKDIGRLPVVDDKGKLVGIVTIKDVGNAVKNFLERT